jgi:hypothetical protein
MAKAITFNIRRRIVAAGRQVVGNIYPANET